MGKATKRRDRGSGSVYQRASDGRWVAALVLPPDPRTGKMRRKVLTGKTEMAVKKKLAAARRDLDKSGDLPTSSPTLQVWLTRWLDKIAAPRLKPRTLETYRGYVERHIAPSIGRHKLDRLTPQHVQQMHEAILGQGLSSTTALQAHRILAKALTDAEREGRVTRNVATLVDAPRRAVATRGALTAAQAGKLLMSVASDELQAVRWGVALLAGLRQGEALGLTEQAIDLDTGVITVSWQLQRLQWQHGCGTQGAEGWPCKLRRAGSCPQRHIPIPAGQEARQVEGGLWLTRPKSRAGWREVPMAPVLHEVMKRYLAGRSPGMEGLVLTRDGGRPMDPSHDSRAWHAALQGAGLPPVPLHSARHTTATLLYELGVAEQTRIKILGHSSATVTAGYTHVAGAEMVDAMGRLGALVMPTAKALEG